MMQIMKFLIVIACKIVLDDFAKRSASMFHSSCFLLIFAICVYLVTCYGSAMDICTATLYELVTLLLRVFHPTLYAFNFSYNSL